MNATCTDISSRPGFSVKGISVKVLADAQDTAGSFEGVVQDVPPGAGSPPHTIAADKVFLILDGEVTLTLDGEDFRAPAGTVAHVPEGTVHNFRNASGRPARLLALTTGGGHVDFLEGLAEGRMSPHAVILGR